SSYSRDTRLDNSDHRDSGPNRAAHSAALPHSRGHNRAYEPSSRRATIADGHFRTSSRLSTHSQDPGTAAYTQPPAEARIRSRRRRFQSRSAFRRIANFPRATYQPAVSFSFL